MIEKATVEQDQLHVLALNSGSSSIKFALYQMRDPPERRLHGKVERIGLPGTTLDFQRPRTQSAGQSRDRRLRSSRRRQTF